MAKPTQKQKITDELFTDICSRIACGELLCDLCQEYGFTRVWFWKWVNQDQERINAYACARIEQQHTFADEILKIADDSTNDTCTKTSKSGEEYDACDNEWINRARVRIDTRKFLMARIAAKDYGDKIQTEISGKDGGPVQHVYVWGDDPAKPATPNAAQSLPVVKLPLPNNRSEPTREQTS